MSKETSVLISTQRTTNNNNFERCDEPHPSDNSSSPKPRNSAQSVLRPSHVSSFNESLLTYKGNEILREPASDATTTFYSVVHDTCGIPALQENRARKVFFPPTKEMVSCSEECENADFRINTMCLDRPSIEKNEENEKIGNKYVLRASPVSTKSLFWQKFAVDPRIPYVLLLYLQLFFNAVLASMVLYLLYILVSTVREDVRNKVEMYTSDAMAEISLCSRQFYRNRCPNEAPNYRAPALEETCMALERCMNRDPQQLGKSKITAETFADIVNGFLHPISWKLATFFAGLVLGGVVVTNIAFGTYRRHLDIHEFTQMAAAAKLRRI